MYVATIDPYTRRALTDGTVSVGYPAWSPDERQLAVTLTPRGVALRKQAEKVPPEIMRQLGMDFDELQRMHGDLLKLIAAATAALPQAAVH